jgi:phosphoribosylformimino-5-aminoimidazole carboxamide ribotide isomerase
MKLKPCIDLHDGKVKQIVGGTLQDGVLPETNFVATQSPAWFARRYREDDLRGGHIIKLGSGNDAAAREALSAWPGALQIGGGITPENAGEWLDAGAEKVIVTSYLFREGQIDSNRLQLLKNSVGKEHLVLDLSCRKRDGLYFVVTDRWQTFTATPLNPKTLEQLAQSCSEFLIHGVDVEGLKQGFDEELVQLLAQYSPISCTYAGGIRSIEDLNRLRVAGKNGIDVTVGSALDLFGGSLPYKEVVKFCKETEGLLDG